MHAKFPSSWILIWHSVLLCACNLTCTFESHMARIKATINISPVPMWGLMWSLSSWLDTCISSGGWDGMEWQGFDHTNFGGDYHVHFNYLGYRSLSSLAHLTSQLKHVVADHIFYFFLLLASVDHEIGVGYVSARTWSFLIEKHT